MKNTKFLLAASIAVAALSFSACSTNSTSNANTVSVGSSTVQNGASSGTVFKMTEVASHNSRTDCWTVINGKVYNLTAYIASGQHKPVIADGCGIDATQIFNNVAKHSGKKAQDALAGLLIGTIGQ